MLYEIERIASGMFERGIMGEIEQGKVTFRADVPKNQQ